MEAIDLAGACGAIMQLVTTCTEGSILIGRGQWQISVGPQANAKKRDTPPMLEDLADVNKSLAARADGVDRVKVISVLAGWSSK